MADDILTRINQLAKLARTRPLTPQEQQERQALRQQYVAGIRAQVQAQLDNISLVEPDGSVRPLARKTDQNPN